MWLVKIFLYSSSVYSCHLFLISSASVRSIPFLSVIKPIFAWNVPLISLIFLKRSLVFPILLFSSISLHWSRGRLSYLSWLIFGTLHSNGNIFPTLLATFKYIIQYYWLQTPCSLSYFQDSFSNWKFVPFDHLNTFHTHPLPPYFFFESHNLLPHS